MSHGAPYEPLNEVLSSAVAQGHYEPVYGDNPSVMQNTYPAGPAMSTFGGHQAFAGDAPGHGGMAAMETSGLTKAGGETGHGGGHGEHGGGEHGGHEHGEMIDKETGQAPRRCTDVQTCFCFLVYAILAFTMLNLSWQYGNTGRLTHGIDYYGRTCGVDAGVENQPFLFWCRTDAPNAGVPADVNLDAPSCVSFCPAAGNQLEKIQCLQPAVKAVSEIPGGQFDNLKTLSISVQESLVETVPYRTYARGGRYCIPSGVQHKAIRDKILTGKAQVGAWDWAQDGRLGLGPFSTNRMFNLIGTLRHLYWLMVVCTVLSILLGYAFIFGIKNCPYQLAKIFLLPVSIILLILAVFYIMSMGCVVDASGGFCEWYKNDNPFNPLYRQDLDKFHADLGSQIFGWVLLFVFFGFVGIMWNFKSIGITDLMNAAFECFKSVPGLYYVPAIEGVAKFVVFWLGMQGFSMIFSMGNLEKNRIHVNGAKYAGLNRHFTPSTHDIRFWFMLVVWIFFFYWIMEFLTSFGQFITSYCVFKYYGVKKEKGKKGKAPGHSVFEAIKIGLIYHPGSILRGALVVPFTRPFRFLNWCSHSISADKPTTFLGNCIYWIKTTLFCCGFLDSAFDKIYKCTKDRIENEDFPVKDAFDDVVIRANDFDQGTAKAHGLLEHSHKIIQYLYRDISQMTINLIGVFAISGTAASAVYLLVSNLDMYKEPASALYVADPIVVTLLSWVLSAYVAFGFMTLWDHTADTLLYCYAWSRRWNRKTVDKYVPDGLRYIVGFDDKEDDRYPYYGKAKNNMYLRYWLPMVGMEDPKKQKVSKDSKIPVMETHAPLPAIGMGRRPASQAGDGSWMSGFGTAWMQRQEQAVSHDQESALQQMH